MRLAVIGYGAIGRAVTAAWRQGDLGPGVELAAVLVRRPRRDETGLPITHDAERFFERDLDVILECAGHQAVRDHGIRCLEAGAVATALAASEGSTIGSDSMR